MPSEPGEYELRLLGPERPYPTLSKRPIRLLIPEASLQAPEQAPIGTAVKIDWRGPSGSGEYITLVPVDTPEGNYEQYQYTRGAGSGSLTLTTPSEPGSYELRFLSGNAYKTLARRRIEVGDIEASLELPASAAAGSTIEISWKGPGNPRDYITIVAPEAAPRDYQQYVYTKRSPVKLPVPEQAGTYEVRYLTADSSRILVRKAIEVGAVTASVESPASVEAGSEIKVAWKGPNNELDYIAVTEVGKPKSYLSYTYTKRGSPLGLAAPREAGQYEVHYLTGRDDVSLASRPLHVTPAAAVGTLRVLAANGETAGSSGPAVALILDASGSMLQKLDGTRRIDLARAALNRLVSEGLADSTRVSLRVFGHRKPDACDTELLQPLAALDRAQLSAAINAIQAKNLAKTPIADSLAAVAGDLAGVEGPAVVVLVTDGEETCDGDPEAAIRGLQAQGFDLVLNIVGFAVDEYALEQQFQAWAELGAGAYYSAKDGDALARGVLQSVRRPYLVSQAGKRVAAGFVGGEAVELKAGRYQLAIGGTTRDVEIIADQETSVRP
nr:VWA domain-containing protein [Pseudomarimonas arenosa]